jgi:hypothetical protein
MTKEDKKIEKVCAIIKRCYDHAKDLEGFFILVENRDFKDPTLEDLLLHFSEEITEAALLLNYAYYEIIEYGEIIKENDEEK